LEQGIKENSMRVKEHAITLDPFDDSLLLKGSSNPKDFPKGEGKLNVIKAVYFSPFTSTGSV
jgi:hypothetical protein